MGPNHGKLAAGVLKRRVWWKISKNQFNYDFIWTPLIRNGSAIIKTLDLIQQLPESQNEDL